VSPRRTELPLKRRRRELPSSRLKNSAPAEREAAQAASGAGWSGRPVQPAAPLGTIQDRIEPCKPGIPGFLILASESERGMSLHL
jgi:hypothetical protein